MQNRADELENVASTQSTKVSNLWFNTQHRYTYIYIYRIVNIIVSIIIIIIIILVHVLFLSSDLGFWSMITAQNKLRCIASCVKRTERISQPEDAPRWSPSGRQSSERSEEAIGKLRDRTCELMISTSAIAAPMPGWFTWCSSWPISSPEAMLSSDVRFPPLSEAASVNSWIGHKCR